MSESTWYHVGADRQPVGPMTEDELRAKLESGEMPGDTLVWKEGAPDWVPASATGEFATASPAGASPAASGVAVTGAYPGGVEAPPRALPAYGGPRGPWGIPAMPPAGYTPASLKKLYVWWWVCVVLAVVVLAPAFVLIGVGSEMADQGDPNGEPLILLGFVIGMVGAIPYISAVVLFFVQLYRWWRQIQDGRAETGPGKAVGFCFIPLFSLYWNFVAYWGLAKDLNVFMDTRGMQGPRPTAGLALTSCIIWAASPVLGCLPCFGAIFPLAGLIIFVIVVHQLHSSSVAVAAHLEADPASLTG